MSTAKARAIILGRVTNASGALFVAIHLDLPRPWALADAADLHGRSIVLIGRHFMQQDPAGVAVVEEVLAQLSAGLVADCVVTLAFTPAASAAFVRIVEESPIDDMLLHGPRWSGKSMVAFAAALGLAEHHLRAGYDGPFRVMLLHDSLKSADAKSAQTLELNTWGGIWTIESDRTRAVCRLGGHDLVKMDFIGCVDAVSSERLRQSSHCVMAEELCGSLHDGVGIQLDQYALARSSMLRLETRRRVSIALTNPGPKTSWPYSYWALEGTPLPSRCALMIPREDRLTPEQQRQLDEAFAANPILQKRLSRGEWCASIHGAAVAEGYDPDFHVAPQPLRPDPALLLVCGTDGGNTPAVTIGQLHNGQIQIFASFNLVRAGLLELLAQQVKPWLTEYAPWSLAPTGMDLVFVLDPSMRAGSQVSVHDTPERLLHEHFNCLVTIGPTRWPARRESLLKALAPMPLGGRPRLQISPAPETESLRDALSGAWYYDVGPDGTPDRSGAHKPSQASDVGDSFIYCLNYLLSGEPMNLVTEAKPITVETAFSLDHRYASDPVPWTRQGDTYAPWNP